MCWYVSSLQRVACFSTPPARQAPLKAFWGHLSCIFSRFALGVFGCGCTGQALFIAGCLWPAPAMCMLRARHVHAALISARSGCVLCCTRQNCKVCTLFSGQTPKHVTWGPPYPTCKCGKAPGAACRAHGNLSAMCTMTSQLLCQQQVRRLLLVHIMLPLHNQKRHILPWEGPGALSCHANCKQTTSKHCPAPAASDHAVH